MSVREVVIERVSGVGLAFRRADGSKAARLRYRITRLREMHDATTFGASEEVEGFMVVRGAVEADDPSLRLVGEELVLHLDDGRRFNFFVANSRGTISPQDPGDVYRP